MNLLTIELNNDEPLYIQLYSTIKNGILNGEIKPNEKLPSKRMIHNHLNISLNTIMQAYDLLLEEGFITSIPKKGYFTTSYKIPMKHIKQNTYIPDLKRDFKYDFTTKGVDKTTFPYFTWNKITRNVLIEDESITSRTSGKGSPELRVTIAKYIFETKGINVNPSNIVIGSGIEYLLTLLLSLIDKSSYALEDPGYDKISRILENNGKKVIYSRVDNEGISVEGLRDADCVYVTPANQFPTGVKMSLSRKLKLIEWANNKYIIEDDFDSEFKYLSNTSISLYALNPSRVILLSTFSRTISPALRISYMILPDELLDRYNKLFSFYSSTVSTIDQMVLSRFIALGSYSRHLNKTKSIYKQKRKIIIDMLDNIKYIHIDKDNSYLSLIIDVDNLDKELFKSLCLDSKIDISIMDDYSKGFKSNKIIIGYSSIPLDDIKNGITLLLNIIDKSTKKGN